MNITNVISFLIDCCCALCMVTIALMVLVYFQDKHDYEKRQRAIRRARAQRIREAQARVMERQLERDKMFEQAQYYEVYETA